VRLSDVLELAVRHGVERSVHKRAGVMLPLAVGAMIPGIVEKALDRAHSTERALEGAAAPKTAAFPPSFAQHAQSANRGMQSAGHATGGGFLKSLGEVAGAPGAGVAGGLSKLVEHKLFGRELGERQDALGIGGASAAKAFGAELGKGGVALLKDIATKAMEAAGHAGDQAARDAIVNHLKKTDTVLAGADDATLMGAYHTMTRFAPVLSTDENAVRSFLRQAVMSGAGPDFMSIKLLADSERAVTGDRKDSR